jgi:hypothetical protein
MAELPAKIPLPRIELQNSISSMNSVKSLLMGRNAEVTSVIDIQIISAYRLQGKNHFFPLPTPFTFGDDTFYSSPGRRHFDF